MKPKKNKLLDLFAKFLSGEKTPRVKRLSLDDITEGMSRSVDELIKSIEEKENASFGSGRFYISELENGIAFKTSVVLYFVKADEPYYEVRREGKVLTMSRLTVEAISTLRRLHEVSYKISAPTKAA